MEIRQEQIVFVGAALLVGWLVVGSLDSGEVGPRASRRSRRGEATELGVQRYPAPDVSLALPARTADDVPPRDLFSEPRNTRPLPPLEFAPPPRTPLAALKPPPEPGPGPRYFGRFLRARPEPAAVPVPGLFLDPSEVEADEGVLEGLSLAVDDDLSAAQRAAQVASWKKLYDWIRVHQGTPLFGTIRNEGRFGLRATTEPILFVEVDPATGLERFPGQDPVPYARDRVLEFDFADTVQNRIRERAVEFGDELTSGQLQPALDLADYCVEQRLVAPDALRVAERLYRAAARFAADDPGPRLGLARCLEAGFRFEEAYEEYLALLEQYEHRSEVHVALAELEARFRLFDQAEERLRTAVRLDRTSWRARWAAGRFLLERGRPEEALPHLEEAYQREPGTEERAARAGIRLDLGRALLRLGRADEAREAFERALQADPEWEEAAAARAGVLVLQGRADEVDAPEQAGFGMLLASGLAALDRGELAEAERSLRLAAEADPLRASKAWRALSWLAEQAGYPDEAMRWIDQAHEADPTDPWTLYQRGRLVAQRDEPEEAVESLRAALDRELDFVEALNAMGEILHDAGDHEAAERYLDRALALDADQPDVHVLRGLNRVELGDAEGARASFRAALSRAPADPVAAAGVAWCAYLLDDADAAVQQFADLDDRRRGEPEGDPYRAYATAQIERLQDHLEKEVWSDAFERRTLRNDWSVGGESSGPNGGMVDGQFVLSGTFVEDGTVRLFREYGAPELVSFSATVTVRTGTRARVGVFLAKERRGRGGVSEVLSKVSLSRHREGGVQVEDRKPGTSEDEAYRDFPAMEWPLDRPVRVTVERVGTGSEAVGRLLLDGIPVVEDLRLRSFASSSGTLRVGVEVLGETGRGVQVTVDDVDVVKRHPRGATR